MHNITVYGKTGCDDLRNALSECPEKYHRAFSKEGTFCAMVREDEPGPYTIIITNKVNSGVIPEIQEDMLSVRGPPEIQEDMLSVRGPDSEKVDLISLKLQEKLGFEISKESMEIFDNLDTELDHEMLYVAYDAFGYK